MRTIMVLMSVIALTAKLAATSYAPPESHEVASTNGKFRVHVDAEKDTHRITGDFGAGNGAWKFTHEVAHHRFFVSDNGEAAAVVHWSWIQDYDLDEPAVAIYGRFGAKRTYSYRELSQPRKPEPGTIGPVGDFWRIWRGDTSIDGNMLTIYVEGGKPRVIDLKNPQPVSQLEGNASNKAEHGEEPVIPKDDPVMTARKREVSATADTPPPADTQDKPEKEAKDEWAKADKAIAEHFKKMNPASRSAVFASALLRKYLPDFKVHVLYDLPCGPATRIFMVHRSGEITPLRDENWSGRAGDKFMRCADIAAFLARQNIQVKNAADAVAVAKLFEEVEDAATYVTSLKINTKDFKLFDKAFIEGCYGPSDWKYSAQKSKDGWTVKAKYIGPPASIMMPPTYEMDLDEQQMFQDLRSHL
jgi:hypothetical protein